MRATELREFLLRTGILVNGLLELEIEDGFGFEDWLIQNLQGGQRYSMTILSLNDFTFHDGWQRFSEALAKSTSLASISFEAYCYQQSDRSLFYEAIAKNTSIIGLQAWLDRALSKSGSIYDDWKLLSQALKNNKSIDSVEINEISYGGIYHRIKIDPHAAANVFGFLSGNNVVTNLRTDCFLSPQEMHTLAEGLKHNTALTSIEFDAQFRDTRVWDFGPLGEGLKHNTTLSHIQLFSVKISCEASKTFFEALTSSNSVSSLRLINITLDGAPDLFFHYLKATQALRKLMIMRPIAYTTQIDPEELYSALLTNTSVTDLTLARQDRSKSISDLIRKMKTLKSLVLEGNLDADVIDGISDALLTNDTLTRLAGVKVPIDILQRNATLKSIVVENMTLEELLEVINTSPYLTSLSVVFHTRFSTVAKEAVTQALGNNYVLKNVSVGGLDTSNQFSKSKHEFKKQS
ncbi:hypothetical protein HW132_34735, partial [Brasilonema sp. CT11]|nr:hypothetical protein [Brasilonema sp. CT11]